jgi:protein-tyrosine phosphatase
LLSHARANDSPRIQQNKIDFLQLPIDDGSISSDNAMHGLAMDCCDRILRGERLYIHCWGGHGRTGVLASLIVGRLYGLGPTEAMQYNQLCHDSRVYHQHTRSPQTVVQRAQVCTVLCMRASLRRGPDGRG